ncbi:MAG: ABC transporter substrate-binding protein [Sumerlaeia bacterium]
MPLSPAQPQSRLSTQIARKLFAFCSFLIVLPLFLACGGGDSGSTSTAPAEGSASAGGSKMSTKPVVVSMPADIQKLDPPQPTDGNSLAVVAHIYDRLFDFDDTELNVVPGLVESYEISEDGTRYTFKLREDATFSDGSPVNAEAVKFTFERIVDTEHPEHYAIAWTNDILGDWFSHIETPDEYTAVFVLHRPFVPLLFNLAIPAASIVSPSHVKAMGSDRIISEPMGSGPYVLEEWKKDAYVRLRARDSHWRSTPKSRTIFFRVQKDANQRMASLKRGEVHLVPVLSPETIGDRAALKDIEIIEQPFPSLGYVICNVEKGPLQSKELRQALNYAIDRESIVNGVLEGTSIPSYGPLPPGMIGYRPLEEKAVQYTYDLEKARALVKASGHEGATIKLLCFDADRPYNTAGVRLAERLQEDYRQIGLDIDIEQMDFGGFLETVRQRTVHELALSGWMADTGDPDNFIYYLFGSDTNRANYKNLDARRLMEEAQGEQDPERRAALYAQAEDIVLEDAPAVFINHAKRLKGKTTNLKGYKSHPIEVDRMWDVWVE